MDTCSWLKSSVHLSPEFGTQLFLSSQVLREEKSHDQAIAAKQAWLSCCCSTQGELDASAAFVAGNLIPSFCQISNWKGSQGFFNLCLPVANSVQGYLRIKQEYSSELVTPGGLLQ
jgi:hypothetical protein